MTSARQMMMLVSCGEHSDAVVNALDSAGVEDWAILQTSQCRLMGHLEFRPPEHEWTCDVIVGVADEPVVKRTLGMVAQAVHKGEVCPDCLAFVWQVEQVPLANSAVDPVCRMPVDISEALSLEYEGKTYYFCSEECRERFRSDPSAFV